jgi:hypothetical protein
MELEVKEALKIVVRIIFIELLRLNSNLGKWNVLVETTASAVYLLLVLNVNCVA